MVLRKKRPGKSSGLGMKIELDWNDPVVQTIFWIVVSLVVIGSIVYFWRSYSSQLKADASCESFTASIGNPGGSADLCAVVPAPVPVKSTSTRMETVTTADDHATPRFPREASSSTACLTKAYDNQIMPAFRR